MRRICATKIVATLGPATSDPAIIEKIFKAGVDVFRLNFSHGSHDDHRARYDTLRELEEKTGRPIAILADLQGPKLRVGTFKNGPVMLKVGATFRFDMDKTPGDETRAPLLHPEIFAALSPDQHLLIDDGKLRLQTIEISPTHALCKVLVGGLISDRKGVNVPGTVLPISALTEKDRRDLAFALELGVDWIALSFVQRPDDIAEAKKLVQGRAGVCAKLEKPSAIDRLDEIVELSDSVMVARGDLGVEMQPEDVPAMQKRIVRTCRKLGRPVIVATQMLESMIHSPTPTRAEASDVATAVYDGADAVMLSAETASGEFPLEAVTIMERIISRVERDPLYRPIMDADHAAPEPTASDAITAAAAQVARTIKAAAIVTFTTSGSTTLRAARERPEAPILCLTQNRQTARRLVLCWGTHTMVSEEFASFTKMVDKACEVAKAQGFADPGETIAITAGVPFGTPGATNILRIAWIR
ncbi:MAG: pyruvate kinase [Proteobacteria bacterium]|nr:pyruvate kinase [Pseudomonadota bacterium]